MAVSRAVLRFGRSLRPLNDDTAFHLLVAGTLRDRGLTFTKAADLVARFSNEIGHVAADPTERHLWIVFVDDPGRRTVFLFAAVSGTHLGNIVTRHPMARTLALHPAVEEAIDMLEALKARKAIA